jgi:hypothetical protein
MLSKWSQLNDEQTFSTLTVFSNGETRELCSQRPGVAPAGPEAYTQRPLLLTVTTLLLPTIHSPRKASLNRTGITSVC